MPPLDQVWQLLDDARARGERPSLSSVITLAADHRISITMADLVACATLLRDRDIDAFLVSPPVSSFVAEVLSSRSVTTMLDPWAGLGTFVVPIAESVGADRVEAIVSNPSWPTMARMLAGADKLHWSIGSPLDKLDDVGAPFDAIVSSLPFGLPQQSLSLQTSSGEIELRDSRSYLIMAKASVLLSERGIGVFIVPNSFFFAPRRQDDVRSSLGTLGLTITACIALPAGTWTPTIGLPASLVFIEKAAPGQMFVAEFADTPEPRSKLLANFRARKPGDSVALGRLVEPDSFASFSALRSQEKFDSLARRFGSRALPMAGVAFEINRRNKEGTFEDKPNAVYIPSLSLGPASTVPDGIQREAVQVVLDPAKALAGYVVGYLNTAVGRLAREELQIGSLRPRIPLNRWGDLRLLLPDPDYQLKTIEATNRARQLASEVQEIENQLWTDPKRLPATLKNLDRVNHTDSLVEWIETLPFPLASILWRYHVAGTDPKTRYDHLLHFFEAYAQFSATLLLSAFARETETLVDLTNALKSVQLSLERSTFGTWVRVLEKLAKHGRTLLNGAEEGRARCERVCATKNRDVLGMLFSSTAVRLLQQVNHLRNLWSGHGGIVGDRLAQERRAELEGHLATLRGEFGNAWPSYVLIRPGSCRVVNGVYQYEAHRAVGSRTPFPKEDFRLAEPLEDGQLHLIEPTETRALRLLPLVMILAPLGGENACYFYNRLDREGARFVSFHFEARAEVSRPREDVVPVLRLFEQST